MRTVLVMGATGLLGHHVMRELMPCCTVLGTTQRSELGHEHSRLLDSDCMRFHVDAQQPSVVSRLIDGIRPDVVVNCIGIVKSRFEAVPTATAEFINGVFPGQLAQLCDRYGSRLIHVSTDCVFSGRQGNYTEQDPPDPIDAYGRTKQQGEPNNPSCLTIRSSFIGRECDTANGLVEWLCSQRGGRIHGYKKAIFSGMTAAVLARLIRDLIHNHSHLRGTWHAAATPISKFSLLTMVNQLLDLNVRIEPDESVVCDRSLDGSRLSARTGFQAPSWPQMISELAADSQLYE